jgi:predicted phosphodiesterase
MKIDLMSDLHVDFWRERINWKKTKNLDSRIALVIGDTANDIHSSRNEIARIALEYEHVIVVDGNHEYYAGGPAQVSQPLSYYESKFQNFVDDISNVTFLGLNRSSIIFDDVAFLGNNGWYDWACYQDEGLPAREAMSEWSHQSNDPVYINFTDNMPDVLAAKHTQLLVSEVARLQDDPIVNKIIIMTHTVPGRQHVELQNNPSWDRFTPSFVNSQMPLVVEQDINHKIKIWGYGHTHFRSDSIINGIRYINNARGYPGECSSWSNLQVEI